MKCITLGLIILIAILYTGTANAGQPISLDRAENMLADTNLSKASLDTLRIDLESVVRSYALIFSLLRRVEKNSAKLSTDPEIQGLLYRFHRADSLHNVVRQRLGLPPKNSFNIFGDEEPGQSRNK